MLLISYLGKLSISLGIVWLFYHFVLRKLTFYNSNRWYLLGYTLLCFFIPFIDISPVLQKNQWTGSPAVSWIPVMEDYGRNEIIPVQSNDFFTVWNIAGLVLTAGMLIMFLRLLFQLISFARMMRTAKAIPGDKVNLFQVDENIIPFSFGNSIFINQHLHTPEELQEIIRHEFVHVKQIHSVDIIWGELLCLVNWYNPFAWLLKKSIRQNLEFIADNKVLENGIDKKQYQYLLLKVIGNNQFSIAPKFNFSSLKKRIAMMNKLKTAKLHLVRFLFILPLLAVILLSFRKQIGDSLKHDRNKEGAIVISGDFTDTVPEVIELNDKGYYIDIKGKDGNCIVVVKDKNSKEVERVLLTKWKENHKYYVNLYGEILPPPPAVPPVPPTPPIPPTDEDKVLKRAFLERNPEIKDIGWVFNNVRENLVIEAHIFKKDGSVEKYDLNNDAVKAEVEKKYGELPLMSGVPPTPPVAVKLPENVKRIDVNFERAEVWLKNGKEETYNLRVPSEKAAFEKKYGKILPPAPLSIEVPDHEFELSPTQESNRAKIGEHFEINDDNKANVRLKDGTIEEYDLSNAAERKKFETKYGKIIEVGAKAEGVNEPVRVVGYSLNKTVSDEPVTVTGHSLYKTVSDAPVTVTGYSLNKTISDAPVTVTGHSLYKTVSDAPVTVTGHSLYKTVSDEPVTVVGYPSKKNRSNESVTGISAEGTSTVIAPARITGEGGVTILNDEGNVVKGEVEILVTITKKTTRDQLDAFIKQMKEKDIELKFDKIEYKNGILVSISGTMKYKDGQNNFSVTDFNKLTLSRIKDGDHLYLRVDTRDNRTVS